MSRTNATPAAIKTAFKQLQRDTALDICEDYREVVTRLKRLADNLAGVFVVASGDAARALEVELRMVEGMEVIGIGVFPVSSTQRSGTLEMILPSGFSTRKASFRNSE